VEVYWEAESRHIRYTKTLFNTDNLSSLLNARSLTASQALQHSVAVALCKQQRIPVPQNPCEFAFLKRGAARRGTWNRSCQRPADYPGKLATARPRLAESRCQSKDGAQPSLGTFGFAPTAACSFCNCFRHSLEALQPLWKWQVDREASVHSPCSARRTSTPNRSSMLCWAVLIDEATLGKGRTGTLVMLMSTVMFQSTDSFPFCSFMCLCRLPACCGHSYVPGAPRDQQAGAPHWQVLQPQADSASGTAFPNPSWLQPTLQARDGPVLAGVFDR